MSSSWVVPLLLLLGLLAAPLAAAEDPPPESQCEGSACPSPEPSPFPAVSGGTSLVASTPLGTVGGQVDYSTERPCQYYDIDPNHPRPQLWPHVLGILTLNTNCASIYLSGP